MKELIPSTQVAPFSHGLEWHSSMSGAKSKKESLSIGWLKTTRNDIVLSQDLPALGGVLGLLNCPLQQEYHRNHPHPSSPTLHQPLSITPPSLQLNNPPTPTTPLALHPIYPNLSRAFPVFPPSCVFHRPTPNMFHHRAQIPGTTPSFINTMPPTPVVHKHSGWMLLHCETNERQQSFALLLEQLMGFNSLNVDHLTAAESTKPLIKCTDYLLQLQNRGTCT